MRHATQCIACGKPISAHEASAEDGRIHAQLTLYGPVVRPCVWPYTMEEAARSLQNAFAHVARALPGFFDLRMQADAVRFRLSDDGEAEPQRKRWSFMRRLSRRRLTLTKKIR